MHRVLSMHSILQKDASLTEEDEAEIESSSGTSRLCQDSSAVSGAVKPGPVKSSVAKAELHRALDPDHRNR